MTQDKFATAMLLIDAANSQDPNRVTLDGQAIPKELLYAQRMTHRLGIFAPDASVHLQLAARAQHIERWTSPRQNYPEGRTGYKQWRSELMLYHAKRAGELLTQAGYGPEDIARVQYLIQKRAMSRDAETQCLEDVICLVFIEHYLADFAEGYDEAKLIDIIQKTWGKMSDAGHAAALALPLSAEMGRVIGKALG